jgi:hypothetical protein
VIGGGIGELHGAGDSELTAADAEIADEGEIVAPGPEHDAGF